MTLLTLVTHLLEQQPCCLRLASGCTTPNSKQQESVLGSARCCLREQDEQCTQQLCWLMFQVARLPPNISQSISFYPSSVADPTWPEPWWSVEIFAYDKGTLACSDGVRRCRRRPLRYFRWRFAAAWVVCMQRNTDLEQPSICCSAHEFCKRYIWWHACFLGAMIEYLLHEPRWRVQQHLMTSVALRNHTLWSLSKHEHEAGSQKTWKKYLIVVMK